MPYGREVSRRSNTDVDQPTRSLGTFLYTCTSAARCGLHPSRANPFPLSPPWWKHSGMRATGSVSPSPCAGLGLDYKNVPGIPINNCADPFLRLPRLAPYIAASELRELSLFVLPFRLAFLPRDHIKRGHAPGLIVNPPNPFANPVARHHAAVPPRPAGCFLCCLHWSPVYLYAGSSAVSAAGCQVAIPEYLAECWT